MGFDDYIAALEGEGAAFAAVIAACRADAPIATCPEWALRDLVLHQGQVHRWATAAVRDRAPKPSAIDVDFRAENPADDDLSAWFVAGHHALVEALRAAPVDLAAFTFLADPPAPRVFWARRQLHETGMHRVDAESALGRIAPFSPEVAADGIDEMLTGFVPRSHTPLHSDVPVSLQVTTTDAAGAWRVTISADPPVTERIIADAMCSVAGPASDVHRALWNRGGIETLAINGDAAVLRLFCDSVKVTWS